MQISDYNKDHKMALEHGNPFNVGDKAVFVDVQSYGSLRNGDVGKITKVSNELVDFRRDKDGIVESAYAFRFAPYPDVKEDGVTFDSALEAKSKELFKAVQDGLMNSEYATLGFLCQFIDEIAAIAEEGE